MASSLASSESSGKSFTMRWLVARAAGKIACLVLQVGQRAQQRFLVGRGDIGARGLVRSASFASSVLPCAQRASCRASARPASACPLLGKRFEKSASSLRNASILFSLRLGEEQIVGRILRLRIGAGRDHGELFGGSGEIAAVVKDAA